MERASFQSLIFAFYVVGFSLLSPIISAIGTDDVSQQLLRWLDLSDYFGCPSTSGLSRTMLFGCAASVLRNLFNGVGATRLQLQGNIVSTKPIIFSMNPICWVACWLISFCLTQVLLGWTRAIPYVALKTANMQAGVAAGMAQGELQGCFNNLQTVMRIIAPLLWSGLYSLGSSKGRPGVFHYGVSAACFVQLILSMLVIRNFQYHGVYQRFWVYFE